MICVNNVSRYFGEKCAVKNVSFEVKEGEILVLLGPNGAGKTTVVRMLSSLLSPCEGSIEISGYNTVTHSHKIKKLIGVVGEQPGLYPRLTMEEYLSYFGELYNVPPWKVKEITEKMINILDLRKEVSYPVETYSKGTRQKVSLIRAILHSPIVLLLDEPTSAMDPTSAKTVRDYIKQLKEQKKTILVCTHNMLEAEYLADRIAIIKHGEIKFIGKPQELKNTLHHCEYQIFCSQVINISSEELEKLFSIKIKSKKENSFVYEVQQPEEINPKLIKYMVEKNVNVISCIPLSQTLEDAYLEFDKK